MRTLTAIFFCGFVGMANSQTTNCAGATQVCNDVAFSGNSSGAGSQELNASNQGCLGVEHQSSWYYFQPVSSGTVALTITTAVDYDFAIWASGNCSSLGAPVRCSYSGLYGNTGLAATAGGSPVTDVSEGAGGDAWVMPLNVVVGQTYIMLIDNFSSNSTPFTLDWTFSNGAALNCIPTGLPIELSSFIGYYNSNRKTNSLTWFTESEYNNDYFTVERSLDGENWSTISVQSSKGNSTLKTEYGYEDYNFSTENENYYRLSQTDKDGHVELLKIIAIDNSQNTVKLVKTVNAMGQEVDESAKGYVILIYNDGSRKSIYR
jgi:hypothetical protein